MLGLNIRLLSDLRRYESVWKGCSSIFRLQWGPVLKISSRSIQSCYIRIISPKLCRNTKIRYVKNFGTLTFTTLSKEELFPCIK